MELYQLRRAIRNNAKFGTYPEFSGGGATARHIGEFIDFAARDIYELSHIHTMPIQAMNWKDDGYPKAFAEILPVEFRAWDANSSPPVIQDRRIEVSPERRKYSDGKGRHMLVVFGIADQRFFIWSLGGL